MRRLACFGIVMALCVGGCDGETEDPDAGTPGTDSGTTPDEDAGTEPDEDAGTEPEEDAGTEPGDDAGAEEDAGSTDGGTTDPDGGTTTTCAPGTVTIEETCPAFTACGSDDPGDVVGEWCYTNVCVEEDELIPEGASAFCSSIEFVSSSGEVTGSVAFTESTVARDAMLEIEATVMLTCTGGPAACTSIQTMLHNFASARGGSAVCETSGGGCLCMIELADALSSADTYTVDETDGEITVGTGADERTYDYCVEDGDLRFRDTSADEREPGIQTLTPDPSS